MRPSKFVLLALLGLGGSLFGQQATEKPADQTKAARATWSLLEAGEPVVQVTENLIVLAPKSMERRLKEIGGNLEKTYSLAVKSLQAKPKDDLWPGKLAVYLLPEREQFTALVRRVEKRRLGEEEAGSFYLDGELPHAA